MCRNDLLKKKNLENKNMCYQASLKRITLLMILFKVSDENALK